VCVCVCILCFIFFVLYILDYLYGYPLDGFYGKHLHFRKVKKKLVRFGVSYASCGPTR